ncbi:hypothetical protein BaRGS_00007139 [Batillaria attramentaria]|uniref:Mitochondrial cytochrome c oxidase subunit VIc/VIIs domain-containing protein n=1 Tax=Batillaria attramentaria TaxID=370345 RepID=A0ABD0LRN1_9CAEN
MLEIKPQLRGILMSRLKLSSAICAGFVLTMGMSFKLMHNDARKKNYRRFYKYYDAEADYERMVEAGVFDSVRPGGEIVPP